LTVAASSRLQFTPDLSICRILNGMWQVSGAHGDIEPVGAIAEMFAYHDAGFTTLDLADLAGVIVGALALCNQPWAKGMTQMVNGIYNGSRFEDVWLDK
jgi:hypothetical protein